MFAHPKLTPRRRWKRRIKAAASIAIALAAGTFLACQRQVSSMTRSSRINAAPGDPSDGPSAAPSPGSAALAVVDARADANPQSRDAAVDVNEHRRGMPVPDNLLE
jgi:hypothetical protein